MKGRTRLFLMLASAILLSALCLSTLESEQSDAYDYKGDTVELTWNPTFAENNGGYNNLNLAPGSGKCSLVLTVQRTSTPTTITSSLFDALETEKLNDVRFTATVTSSVGSNTTIIRITFQDVSELPEVSVLKIADPSEKKNKLSVTLRIHIGDVIVTASDTGNQVAVLSLPEKNRKYTWTIYKFSRYEEMKILDLAAVKGNIHIIYDGAKAGTVNIFSVSDRTALNSMVDFRFSMYSGSIDNLGLLSIPKKILDTLGTSYDDMPSPIHSAVLELIKGDITVLSPTVNMVSVIDYSLHLHNDIKIDRLLTTGENGKYSSVNVTMTGGKVGYMTNIASRIGTLTYEFVSGSIDYLCLGANTEHYRSSNLAKMSTSYVNGDVTVRISPYTEIIKCIVGGGIMNIPNILSNGTEVTDTVVHMIVIDAPSTTIYCDSAFLTDTRTSAFQMTNYKIGGNIYSRPLMDTFFNKGVSSKVYSEDGVWDSPSSSLIPAGGILSANACISIPKGSNFTVSAGGSVYNSNEIILTGTLVNNGLFINNSIIQCGQESILEGKFEGIGYVADQVHYSTPTESMNVMSNRTSVVIEQSVIGDISSISAILGNDRRSVTIESGDEPIHGDRFLLSLQEAESPEDFDTMYRLDIYGIGSDILESCKISVSIHTDPNMSTAVYGYDLESKEYVIISTASYQSEMSFDTEGYSKLYVMKYIDDRPNPNPNPSPITTDDISGLDYLLISAIIAVLCVTIYAIITMKRD